MRTRKTTWKAKLTALAGGCVVAFVILEVGLRIIQPFEYRVRGDAIILPQSGRYDLSGQGIPGLDQSIVHTRNSIGFRGPEPPANLSEHISILTIGGSTTECHFISDGLTWPDLLASRLNQYHTRIWLNNAGLDGHSSFGHHVLLSSELIDRLRPKVLLFLVGCNEIGRDDLTDGDWGASTKSRTALNSLSGWARWLAQYSEVVHFALLCAIKIRHPLYHDALPLDTERNLIETEIASLLSAERPYVQAYEERLRTLIAQAQSMGANPILITQPSLVGDGIDPRTGANLETVAVKQRNGKAFWLQLELYNTVTRSVGAELNVMVIDLARLMPKDSTFFYDEVHFTNAGAAKVADILAEYLRPELARCFPESLKQE